VKAIVAADANRKSLTSKAAKFTVNPKVTGLAKVAPASKAFTAKWKKQAKQTTGCTLIRS